MYAAVVLCLADWVLVEDFGFFGGVGTDPNSMIPICLVFVAGFLALRPVPAVATATDLDRRRQRSPTRRSGPGSRAVPPTPSALWRRSARSGSASVGVVPMAAASVNPNADPIITEAINGQPGVVDTPAPHFSLVDQDGATLSLASFRGRAVAITFLDPVCVSDCPLIAQEFRQADGAARLRSSRRVALVAVVANPVYRARPYLLAFDRQEGLQKLAELVLPHGLQRRSRSDLGRVRHRGCLLSCRRHDRSQRHLLRHRSLRPYPLHT